VLDSRDIRDGEQIRRRRECAACSRRFTTYETVEQRDLIVVKRDGRRERFDPRKQRDKLHISLTKRPVPVETEAEMLDSGMSEVPSTWIGETVLGKLRDVDAVAYIRFASVYREFRDLDDWRREFALLDSPKSEVDR
jgi:transcriptional repressor NrdR